MKRKLNCILLIEDNEFTNIFNKKLIASLGITEHIYFTENGEEGLDFLRNKSKFQPNDSSYPNPDIIFLDINMPGMNGWEFIEEYEEISKKKGFSAKIVMLTTSPNPDDEQKAKSIAEIIAFKRKPLTKITIQEILTEHFSDYL